MELHLVTQQTKVSVPFIYGEPLHQYWGVSPISNFPRAHPGFSQLIGQTFERHVAAAEGARSARGYLESPKRTGDTRPPDGFLDLINARIRSPP